ncbi:hypothetical protein FACS1894139_05070 [Planctomycetales bacterium]|nr:hypothetical protein FACS1894108_02810 [Planctomycetales bacterium]GHT03855.1 hypothetical protein FACS1894139_05070 [Planctomycetales bacterium]
MINFAGVSSATVEPWKRKNLLASKVNKVVAVIASGADIKYENAQMTEEVKLSLVGTVQKITNIVMGVVWDILGDIAGQILGKVIDDKINGAEIASELAKELTKELAKVGAGELIGRILGILSYFHSMGMDAFLDLFNGNPPETTPPQVSIKFTYKMKLRPGSLFWLIAGGDRSITLNRNDGARQRGQVGTPPLLMHTSGQYFDRPGMAPELWAVNYFPGDSTFPDPEDDDWDPQKMFGREMFGY